MDADSSRDRVTPSGDSAALAGLNDAVAHARHVTDGPNELPRPRRTPAIVHFAAGLVHFFALMLWTAAALAWLADLPTLTVAIAGVVVVNALFAFVQEQRADRAAEQLEVLLPSEVTVRRSGRDVVIDASEVVRGDLLVLEAGARICADARIVGSTRLQVDLSMLTGESGGQEVAPGDDVFAGTFVVGGAAVAEVTAIGSGTRLSGIARLATSTRKPDTPLTRELGRLVRTIAAIAVGVGVGFFVVVWLAGRPLEEGVVFGIGVTVALVPEALLPTVTLSLAWGAEQMAHRNVLVRHLDAVETLGSTTFICTDKTGTLTCNEMNVVGVWSPLGDAVLTGQGYGPDAHVVLSDPAASTAIARVARAARECSTGRASRSAGGVWTPQGDPMEAAIDALARRLHLSADPGTNVEHFEFDSTRRRTSSIRRSPDGRSGWVAVKGAPELLLPLCTASPATAVEAAERALADYASAGRRVLAVARRPWHDVAPATMQDAESSLELLGLLALHDPPREGVHEAIAACRRAGVRVAMMTGDHPDTARAIASDVGLLGPDRCVVTGDSLPADQAALAELVDRDGVVIARVTPEDKLRIARALRSRAHVVAMTGDGVNDAPALHEADIGIAMGRSGTDVAREAADLVLLDDHFASIVAGIEQGRATFLNVRRFLTYHLTDNVAELTPLVVWALSGGQFPLALGVLQILALDLGTDTLSAVALGAEKPAPHILEGPPVSGRLLDRTVARRAFALLGPVVAFLTMSVFTVVLWSGGWRSAGGWDTDAVLAASGAAFLTVVAAQTANAFACRSSTHTPWELGWTTNRLLVPAASLEVVFAVSVVVLPWAASRLDHAAPEPWAWALALTSAPFLLAVDAVDKRRRGAPPSSRDGRGGRADRPGPIRPW